MSIWSRFIEEKLASQTEYINFDRPSTNLLANYAVKARVKSLIKVGKGCQLPWKNICAEQEWFLPTDDRLSKHVFLLIFLHKQKSISILNDNILGDNVNMRSCQVLLNYAVYGSPYTYRIALCLRNKSEKDVVWLRRCVTMSVDGNKLFSLLLYGYRVFLIGYSRFLVCVCRETPWDRQTSIKYLRVLLYHKNFNLDNRWTFWANTEGLWNNLPVNFFLQRVKNHLIKNNVKYLIQFLDLS